MLCVGEEQALRSGCKLPCLRHRRRSHHRACHPPAAALENLRALPCSHSIVHPALRSDDRGATEEHDCKLLGCIGLAVACWSDSTEQHYIAVCAKRKTRKREKIGNWEALWPIFEMNHQRRAYTIYSLYYSKKISQELCELCLDQGHSDSSPSGRSQTANTYDACTASRHEITTLQLPMLVEFLSI